MIPAPVRLTAEQQHERKGIRAAVHASTLLLIRLPLDHPLRPRAEALADEAAAAMRAFWQGVDLP